MATTPTTELDPRFSSPGATARPWDETAADIERAELYWLTTVRPDGRPHVTPLCGVWLDGTLHFCTGPTEQKARNLATNAACVLTTGSNHWTSGIDVVVEGTAVPVADEDRLRQLAAAWLDKYEGAWRFEVRDGAFHSVEAGRADVFAVRATKAFAFSKGEPFGQSRYRFA